MKRFVAALLLSYALILPVMGQKLVKKWETEPVLSSAESVLYSERDQLLFVSNMGPSQDPMKKDGDGSIGLVAPDGQVINANWVTGLDAPKGLGLHRGHLYVADIDRVHVIDVEDARIVQTIPIDGARSLNDVSVNHAGTVYVSDYSVGKVFAINGRAVTVKVPEILKPNGVLWHENDLFVLAAGTLYQARVDGSLKGVVAGLDTSVDGIEYLRGDEFIVSCSSGIIYQVNVVTGEKWTLLDRRSEGIQSADIGFNRQSRIVYAPSLFTHRVIAYRLDSGERPEQVFSFECPELDGTTPDPAVRKIIERNEKRLLEWVLSGNQKGLDTLLADAMSYVHENGQVSTKEEFFRDYLPQGYIDVHLEPKEEMRQFCSTVTTVSRGYFRLRGEREYPPTAVTHIWVMTEEGEWVLAHRHESHKGPALGEQLPQEGSANNTHDVGAKPPLEVAKVISANEAAWCQAMVDNDAAVMDRLMNDSLHYVHVTDHTSSKADFMHELSTGFVETDFKGTTLRQFGNTVIALHNAHYWHTDKPDQSRSQAMHCWVRFGDQWRIVSRHSARFLPY